MVCDVPRVDNLGWLDEEATEQELRQALADQRTAIYFWETPDLTQWGWLFFVGLMATVAHFGMARALSLVEASSVVPLDFTRLPFAAAIGYFAFGEVPSVWIWPGAALIMGSAIYIARREARLQRIIPRAPKE